jgi:hypothetical protein
MFTSPIQITPHFDFSLKCATQLGTFGQRDGCFSLVLCIEIFDLSWPICRGHAVPRTHTRSNRTARSFLEAMWKTE